MTRESEMWYYKRAVTIDGNRIGQVYYKIYRWHKVNEETSLGYAFFMTDAPAAYQAVWGFAH